MEQRSLEAFLRSDLERSFERYGTERFVKRWLRQRGVNRVGDLLALDSVELEEFLIEANRTTRSRVVDLYRELVVTKARILRAASPRPVVEPPETNTDEHAEEPRRSDVENRRAAAPIIRGQSISNRVAPEIPAQGVRNQASPTSLPKADDRPQTRERAGVKVSAAVAARGSDVFPIQLGRAVAWNRFGQVSTGDPVLLPFDENGLRRHVLIAGSTGSGKTVAARFIIEQAAIAGVPSLVVDAQGDLSSLVIQAFQADHDTFLESARAIKQPRAPRDEETLSQRVRAHLGSPTLPPPPLFEMLARSCSPRIFTPGRPVVGLPLALPPFVDVLASWSGVDAGQLAQEELDELLNDEIENFVRLLLPKAKHNTHEGLVHLLIQLCRKANVDGIGLEGREGIDNLLKLVDHAAEFVPELFDSYLTDKDLESLRKAIFALGFSQHEKWLKGTPLDVAKLCRRTPDGRTPINIVNVQELASADDKKRVLRHLIAGVYKFAVNNPVDSGPPSLILYLDEVGTGYGERSIGKPDREAHYRVYQVLSRLVSQARKYGVSVILASQAYTHFSPELRRQLCTKIIGKVDDGTEQRRILTNISEDSSHASQNPREAVERELPRLGPPRLLLVSVKGRAQTYDQLKCCSLDVVLTSRDVQRWRQIYEEKAKADLAFARQLLDGGLPDDVGRQLDMVEDATRFIADFQDATRALHARLDLRVGEVGRALDALKNAPPGGTGHDDWRLLAAGLGALHKSRGDWGNVELALRKQSDLAQSPGEAEALRLELAKVTLLRHRDVEAAEPILATLTASTDKRISAFARAWKEAISGFWRWSAAWGFLRSPTGGTPRLVTPTGVGDSLRVLTLSVDETNTSEEEIYVTELVCRTEILHPFAANRQEQPALPGFAPQSGLPGPRTLEHYAAQLREATRLCWERKYDEAFCAIGDYLAHRPPSDFEELLRPLTLPLEGDEELQRIRLGHWLDALHWREFELEIADLFARMGYSAWATKASGDGGVDVRAIRDDETVIVQCKHYRAGSVGLEVVQALHGARQAEEAVRAVLVTTSALEPGARVWAESVGVEVLDREDLINLLQQFHKTDNSERQSRRATAPVPPLFRAGQLTAPTKARPPVGKVTHKETRPSSAQADRSVDDGERVVALARGGGRVKNHDVQLLLHIDAPSATRLLSGLMAAGLLVRHGQRRGSYYTLPGSHPSGPPATDRQQRAKPAREVSERRQREGTKRQHVQSRSSADVLAYFERISAAEWRALAAWARTYSQWNASHWRVLDRVSEMVTAGSAPPEDDRQWAARLHSLALRVGFDPKAQRPPAPPVQADLPFGKEPVN